MSQYRKKPVVIEAVREVGQAMSEPTENDEEYEREVDEAHEVMLDIFAGVSKPTEREPLTPEEQQIVDGWYPRMTWKRADLRIVIKSLRAELESTRTALRAAEERSEQWSTELDDAEARINRTERELVQMKAIAMNQIDRAVAAESSLTRYKTALQRCVTEQKSYGHIRRIALEALEESPEDRDQ